MVWPLGVQGKELSLLPCRQLFVGFFPKGLCIDWELWSNWGGIGASRGFHSRNDAGEAFSAGHLLPAGLGARASVRSTPEL